MLTPTTTSDRKQRTAALEELRSRLSQPATATQRGKGRPATSSGLLTGHLDPLKLWKALFYALWMCDRPVPQQRLCDELASLLFVRGMAPWMARARGDDGSEGGEAETDAALAWLAAFWTTVAREWTTGIDVLRMDKFLLLVRRVHAASLRWLVMARRWRQRSAGENDGDLGMQVETRMREEVWAGWPFDLSGDLAKMPVGLRLHVLDIWVDELARSGFFRTSEAQEGDGKTEGNGEGNDARTVNENDRVGGQGDSNSSGKVEWEPWMAETVAWMKERVEEMAKRSATKAIRQRAQDSLEDERLASAAHEDVAMADDDDESWNGFDD